MTHRGWVFTDYELGPTESHSTRFALPCLRYSVWQLERCPKTDRLHFQGYLELPRQQRLSWLKVHVSSTAHFDPRAGTPEQARTYCMKTESREDGPWEYGEQVSQGKRSDLQAIADLAASRQSLQVIAQAHPTTYIKFHRGIESLSHVLNPPKPRPFKEIIYIYGPSRVGKTRYVMERYPDAFYADDNPQGWLDGYQGQDTIIFDEFDGKYPRTMLLKLCSHVPMRSPIKGGYVTLYATTIVFTSNRSPYEIYAGCPAWEGRLSEGLVVDCSEPEWRDSITRHFDTRHTDTPLVV